MMSEFALYSAYLSWLGHNGAVSLKHLFDFPLASRDVYEDDSKVVNHIIYFVPDLSGSVPRGFFFWKGTSSQRMVLANWYSNLSLSASLKNDSYSHPAI